MPKAGSEYTEEAAKFFRTLGLTAEIEKKVVGARGSHNIDVWITGKIQSFQVRWIIECKDWKSSVPKEKVLALQAIALDIGSDRAFLLSESGFQAGAVRCAQFTNITLTSLNDLREQTREQFAQTALWTLYARVSQVIDDLNKEPARIYLAGPATGCLYDNPEIDNKVIQIKRLAKALIQSFRGIFPVTYGYKKTTPLIAETAEQLIDSAGVILAGAERLLAKLRRNYPDNWYKNYVLSQSTAPKDDK